MMVECTSCGDGCYLDDGSGWCEACAMVADEGYDPVGINILNGLERNCFNGRTVGQLAYKLSWTQSIESLKERLDSLHERDFVIGGSYYGYILSREGSKLREGAEENEHDAG